MITTIYKNDYFILFSLTIIYIIVSIISLIEGVYSILVLFSIFLVLSIFAINIFSKKYFDFIIWLFVFALLINFCAMIFSAYSFQFNLGTMLGGNDEGKYYFEANRIADHWMKREHTDPRMSKVIHVYFISFISFLAKFFGENHPINLKLISVFFGSFIPLIIFNFYFKKYNFNLAKKVAIWTTLFPILIYYSSLGVRDIILTFLTCCFIYILICNKMSLNNFFWLSILTFFIFGYRVENGIFMVGVFIAFLFYYFLFKTKINSRKIVITLLLIFIISGIILLYYSEIINLTFDRLLNLREKYLERASRKEENSDSFLLKLTRLPLPINYISRFGAALLSTFPPTNNFQSPFFKMGSIDGLYPVDLKYKISIGRTMKVLGPIIWYFILPFIIMGSLFYKKISVLDFDHLFIVYMGYLYVFLVSVVTIDIGRLLPVYPILFSFGILVKEILHRKDDIKIRIINILVLISLFGVYYLVKLFVI